MDLANALMMYGLAAVMIFFIALITAGTIAGTAMVLVSLVGKIRDAQQASTLATIGRSKPIATDALG